MYTHGMAMACSIYIMPSSSSCVSIKNRVQVPMIQRNTQKNHNNIRAAGSSQQEPITVMEDEKMQKKKKKPRFLCLHGYQTSAEIMKIQFRKSKWPESVLGKLELYFINAPHPCKRSSVERMYDPPFYDWFHASEDLRTIYHFETCLAYIEDYMLNSGPFDGVMGFSQGALIAAAMPGLQREGVGFTKVPELKALILMAASKFGGIKFGMPPKVAVDIYSSPITIPSLHFIGQSDSCMREPANEVLEHFEDPELIYHPQGHTVPRLDEKSLKTTLTFIEKVEKIVAAC